MSEWSWKTDTHLALPIEVIHNLMDDFGHSFRFCGPGSFQPELFGDQFPQIRINDGALDSGTTYIYTQDFHQSEFFGSSNLGKF
jgi:hypothetical protein